MNASCQRPESDQAGFTVITSIVSNQQQIRVFQYRYGMDEIQSMLDQILLTLGLIPFVAHCLL